MGLLRSGRKPEVRFARRTLRATLGLLAFAAMTFLPRGVQAQTLQESLAVNAKAHYEPVAGRLIGVYPGAYPDVWPLNTLKVLRLQFGITGLFRSPDSLSYTTGLMAGFSPDNMMVAIYDAYASQIDAFPAGMYYIDEPEEHTCTGQSIHPLYSPDELAARQSYVHTHRPGSKFVISCYKLCSHNRIGSRSVDGMMYSSYKNWTEFLLPVCPVNLGWGDTFEKPWIPGSPDQRPIWTLMRSTFGPQFSMTWMTAQGDEYADLFQHADTLGLSAIWLYDPLPFDSTFFESFCSIAWQKGWLAKVVEPFDVPLASFTATVDQNHHVLLQWSTLSPVDTPVFDVQRRGNAGEFENIPRSLILGPSTSQPHHYSFVDSTATPGRLWYRLKHAGLQGVLSYSQPISITVSTGDR